MVVQNNLCKNVSYTYQSRILNCFVKNTVLYIWKCYLQAPEPPKILAALGDTDTSAGGSAMLEFKMRGYPRPNIKWTKDGQLVGTDDRHKFVYPDPESVALIISKVAGEDVGTYKVNFMFLKNINKFTSSSNKLIS